jgi:hypothetical protein
MIPGEHHRDRRTRSVGLTQVLTMFEGLQDE